jgi:putative endonuclease
MVYYVYIITNPRHTVLYTGVTNDIVRRSFEHKVKENKKSFTARYNCNKLIYFEEFGDITEAIHREKQLKKYRREWKLDLITKMNADWKDLSEDWIDRRELEFAMTLKTQPQQ